MRVGAVCGDSPGRPWVLEEPGTVRETRYSASHAAATPKG